MTKLLGMKKALCIILPILTFIVGIGVGVTVHAKMAAHYAREMKASNTWRPDNRSLVLPVSDDDNELKWGEALADLVGGKDDYVLPNGLEVDLLTEKYAGEIDWLQSSSGQYKWYEGISQSLAYAHLTGKEPVLAIGLKGNYRKDRLELAKTVANKNRIHVWELRAGD